MTCLLFFNIKLCYLEYVVLRGVLFEGLAVYRLQVLLDRRIDGPQYLPTPLTPVINDYYRIVA